MPLHPHKKKEIKVDTHTYGLVIKMEGYGEEYIKLKNQALVGQWVFYPMNGVQMKIWDETWWQPLLKYGLWISALQTS